MEPQCRAQEIEFEDDSPFDDDQSGGSYFEIEGRITQIVDSQSFYIGTLLVIHDSSTRWEHGGPAQLAIGRRVEVEGVRTDGTSMRAQEIEFEDD